MFFLKSISTQQQWMQFIAYRKKKAIKVLLLWVSSQRKLDKNLDLPQRCLLHHCVLAIQESAEKVALVVSATFSNPIIDWLTCEAIFRNTCPWSSNIEQTRSGPFAFGQYLVGSSGFILDITIWISSGDSSSSTLPSSHKLTALPWTSDMLFSAQKEERLSEFRCFMSHEVTKTTHISSLFSQIQENIKVL